MEKPNKLVIIKHGNSGRELVRSPMYGENIEEIIEKIQDNTKGYYLVLKDEYENDVLITKKLMDDSTIIILNDYNPK